MDSERSFRRPTIFQREYAAVMIHETHIVEGVGSSIRIYDYLPGKFHAITSRKGIKKAFERQQIKCNGFFVKGGAYIQNGDCIELLIAAYAPKRPFFKRLPILYEDNYLAIIHKPPGLVVSGNQWKTLENAVAHLLEPSTLLDALPKPLAAHRIDATTGGIVLLAKTYSMRTKLGDLFESKAINKQYLALAHGKLSSKEGAILTPIDGKSSATQYEVLGNVTIDNQAVSLIACSPITGRKHQLRIHFAEMGHPLVGDKKYGISQLQMDKRAIYLFNRRIAFTHPETDEVIAVTAAIPKKFRRILEKIKVTTENFS
jgi:23S rRNA pseudouridine1911/1915/1917 synthase